MVHWIWVSKSMVSAMLLDDKLIKTREVTEWQGLHLLHFDMSSCSQKVRILIGELGINYVSHPINLMKDEQRSDWYLGINARGQVPVLVHDGRVHIESNDIIEYLNQTFISPNQLFLPNSETEQDEMHELMDLEDQLHVDLRTVTFTYLAPDPSDHAPAGDGSLDFLERFHNALLILDGKLNNQDYLIGDRITLADISWYITLHRLDLAGYPLSNYPSLNAYYQQIAKRPAFRQQISAGPLILRVGGTVYRHLNRWFKNSLPKDFKRWQLAQPNTSS